MHRAFTLIELLVVISIIAILAAMLVPAIKIVRDSARTAVCMNQQRQLAISLHGYGNDWDGMLMPLITHAGVRWDVNVADFCAEQAKKMNSCPSFKSTSGWGLGYGRNARPLSGAYDGDTGYFLDEQRHDNFWNQPLTAEYFYLARIPAQARRILVGDSKGYVLLNQGWWWNIWSDASDPHRHAQKKAVYAFFDGRVSSYGDESWLGVGWPEAREWNP